MARRITSDDFVNDNGTVSQRGPKECLAKIVELSLYDPDKYTAQSRKSCLILIRRCAKQLAKELKVSV